MRTQPYSTCLFQGASIHVPTQYCALMWIHHLQAEFGISEVELSQRYDPSETNPRELPVRGGDKEVSGFQYLET